MIINHQLPQFLWEQAVANAVYVCNCAFTTSLRNKIPYETWFKRRLNISHLQEFGAPVWILLQGQKEPPKMLPKSHRHAYFGYDDGSSIIMLKQEKFSNLEISVFLPCQIKTPFQRKLRSLLIYCLKGRNLREAHQENVKLLSLAALWINYA